MAKPSKTQILDGGNGNDILVGGRGNDYIDGHGGNDTLTGGAGADTFYFHFDGSNDVITDFDEYDGDRLILDSGTGVYSGWMYWGWLVDGSVLTNHEGTASFFFNTGDFNGDGITDMQITSDANAGSLTILGHDQVYGYNILGG